MSRDPLKTVIHKLRPIKRNTKMWSHGEHWHLRWRPVKHGGCCGNDGTWNLYWSRFCGRWRTLGGEIQYEPSQGSQYGRTCRALGIHLKLWWGELTFWVKWGFIASTHEHGDGVAGIDLASWGIEI